MDNCHTSFLRHHLYKTNPSCLKWDKSSLPRKSFCTSFITTSFIEGFKRLGGWATCLKSCSIWILCIQYDGLIPFKSIKVHPITSLFTLNTFITCYTSFSDKILLMIIGFSPFSSRKTYFRWDDNCFNSIFQERLALFNFDSSKTSWYTYFTFSRSCKQSLTSLTS